MFCYSFIGLGKVETFACAFFSASIVRFLEYLSKLVCVTIFSKSYIKGYKNTESFIELWRIIKIFEFAFVINQISSTDGNKFVHVSGGRKC